MNAFAIRVPSACATKTAIALDEAPMARNFLLCGKFRKCERISMAMKGIRAWTENIEAWT